MSANSLGHEQAQQRHADRREAAAPVEMLKALRGYADVVWCERMSRDVLRELDRAKAMQ